MAGGRPRKDYLRDMHGSQWMLHVSDEWRRLDGSSWYVNQNVYPSWRPLKKLIETIDILEKENQGIFGPNGGYSRAMALTSMTWMAGLMSGPLLGGLIVQQGGYFALQCFVGRSHLSLLCFTTLTESGGAALVAGCIAFSFLLFSLRHSRGVKCLDELYLLLYLYLYSYSVSMYSKSYHFLL
jgi:hypothetical protein